MALVHFDERSPRSMELTCSARCLQEIVSYIKGSAEAMQNPTGKLTLEQYLEVGRKRAPNFTADTRRQVFDVFLQYERDKVRFQR